MRIPMGQFQTANVVPTADRNRVVTLDADNRGQQALAAAVGGIAERQIDQQNQEAKALARVKATNLLMDRERQIGTITTDLGEKLRQGLIDPDQAQSAYAAAVGKLDPVQPQGLDQVELEQFGLGLRKVQESGFRGIEQAVGQARIATARSDLDSRMDVLGKDAALPGAKPEALIARMNDEDIDTVGRMAYGVDWSRRKQDFADGVYMTHANQQLISARNDLGALQSLQTQLTAEDGYYTTKLDPDRRNQLLNSVTGKIFQVQEHNARQAEIREQRAMRILDQMDRQAATGIPPSPAEQQRWQAALSGTSMASEYASRVEQMNQVQTLLRMPLAEQQSFIQQQRQQLATNGGSVDQIANVDRLERAVTENMQRLRDQPLEANAMMTGTTEEPLDLSGIASPDGQAALSAQIAARMDTINAMRKQFGIEVARNPFMPQEAGMLKAALAQADDNTKLQVVGAIAQATTNANDFAGALKAIAADDQPLMLAGMAQARQLKGADGADVAPLILAGNKVLKDKSSPMPTEAKLRAAFDESVGQAIPSGSSQREQAFAAYKALYAGMAGPAGVTHDGTAAEVDEKLAAKALEMATGGVSEVKSGFFGSGNKVVRPYGMSDGDFQDALGSQIGALAERSGIAKGSLESMPLMPVQGTDGAYYLLNGGRMQLDPKTGEPMIVRVR